ncbi:NAD(P)/FAD-dependent oxidoreductase [Rhodococcus sp. ACS1]|uniref:NAD(P)/FAD-dependent oxidoreductase n=1 Tax=Rhodococcus sp. ACS1 TaxID=2028570 RepID=UPI00211CF6B4|nr:FAD-dependent oxidoreductase [Rhodococcus sp. ACS1]
MKHEHPLIVVGASLAGLRAVEAARREGWGGPITLLGAEPVLPYDRPPLSKAVLADGAPVEFKPFRTEAELVTDLGVTLALGERATGLDLDRSVITTNQRTLAYSRLVIATGSSPIPLPGVKFSDRILSLRTWHDAVALRRRLNQGGRLAVVGAGFIGAEIASAAVKRGLEVTLLEAAEAPLVPALGTAVARALAGVHAANGVTLATGVRVAAITESGGSVDIDLADGSRLTADTVVVGVGSRPQTGWLEGSGLTLDNGVVCDATLSAAPNVYAAGDVARWPNALFGDELMRLEHWTSAAEQGIWAGCNAARETAESFQTVPYFWSDWYGNRIQFLGTRSDDVEIIGSGDKFVALYSSGPKLVGVLGLNSPMVMRLRAAIVAGDDVDSVREGLLAGTAS